MRALVVVILFSLTQQPLWGQDGIGVQGGPFLTIPAWEAKEALGKVQGWTVGLQVVEGQRGESGFKVGLDAGQRAFDVRALGSESNLMEEFSVVSTMLWLSFEMRWSLSRKHRVFLELGPVIGVEVHEKRSGIRYFEGEDFFGTSWRTDAVAASETESGFAIRDGRWRIGITTEWPVAGRWFMTGGAYLAPGVGNWALGHGYATLDTAFRAGLLYMLRGRKLPGRR